MKTLKLGIDAIQAVPKLRAGKSQFDERVLAYGQDM